MTSPFSAPNSNGEHKHSRIFALILFVILGLLMLYMVASILAGLVGGVLLWVTTRAIYDAILKRVNGRRGLAAGLSVLATLLVVIVPLSIIIVIMTTDAFSLAGDIQEWIPLIQSRLSEWMTSINSHGLSLFGYEISSDLVNAKIGELTTTLGQFILSLTQRTFSSIISVVVMLFVALYTLYYFYTDGDRFIGWFKDTVPLEPRHSTLFIESFFTSSIATLKMIGVIGVIQGVLAGIAYVIIGVPAPFFLTILTILASAIPTVGGGLIIVPVAIGLFIAGKTAWAIALLAWLFVVISNIDNILRPHLLHKSMHLHQLVIFVATLGGIARFGFFGVLIGPVVASLFSASLEVYREIYPRPAAQASRRPDRIHSSIS